MDIFDAYYKAGNNENALKMSQYMKNLFPFLGINKPERERLSKDFIKLKKKEKQIDWNFIKQCYDLPEREFQYLAMSYLFSVKNLLVETDIYKIEELITTKSWWDSTDTYDGLVGELCLKYPHLIETVIKNWMDHNNIWLKRVSIDFQLAYKEKTNQEILALAILKNCHTNEFFINKAIGWALREYSKTNIEWVKEFIKNHPLHPLSIREASKYLDK